MDGRLPLPARASVHNFAQGRVKLWKTAMRYSEYYSASAHPRRSAETRLVGQDGVHMTRIKQGPHGLDDPATDELIVGVVLGGVTRCRWTWGDRWNETAARRAGDIGLTPPKSGGTFEVDGDHEILVIGFPLQRMIARGQLDDQCERPFGRLHDSYHRDRRAFELCRSLWRLGKESGDVAEMAAEEVTAQLIARWRALSAKAQQSQRFVKPLDARVFARIQLWIAEDPGAHHRLQDWALLAGMTAPAFCRAFAARAGLPPHQYLLMARLRVAEQLLALPGSDIDTIAEMLGFHSRSHFTRVFARLRGRTPRG